MSDDVELRLDGMAEIKGGTPPPPDPPAQTDLEQLIAETPSEPLDEVAVAQELLATTAKLEAILAPVTEAKTAAEESRAAVEAARLQRLLPTRSVNQRRSTAQSIVKPRI